MTDEQLDQAVIAVGKDAEAFIKSSLGRFITSRVQDEISLAVEELKKLPATDSPNIQIQQNKIWRAEALIVWLAEIVQEGRNMEQEIERGELED